MNTTKHTVKGTYEAYFKRLIDIAVSALVLVLFWWVYALLAVIVRVNLGSPVMFTQDRPGKDGKVFKLYKFRSMSDARDENGKLLPDKMRLTRFGKLLRASSLDELPELFNILKGDMSLVGPRPLLVEHLKYYTDYEWRRLEVVPGLTGLAQVSGRNALSWEDKFKKDIEYVDNVTFLMDFRIVLLTVKKVFVKESIDFGENHQILKDYYREHYGALVSPCEAITDEENPADK